MVNGKDHFREQKAAEVLKVAGKPGKEETQNRTISLEGLGLSICLIKKAIRIVWINVSKKELIPTIQSVFQATVSGGV